MSVENLFEARNSKLENKLGSEIVPIPRYTYPVIIGLGISFPSEFSEQSLLELVARVGALAPYAVALNEVGDIGISAEIKIDGARQEQIIPLIQTKNLLFDELERRRGILLERFPQFENTIKVLTNDFELLSRNRDFFRVPMFAELDSGIIEAAFTEFAMPRLMSKNGVDFYGKPCQSVQDLEMKYDVYNCASASNPGSPGGYKRIRRLHALEMVMKMDDDVEGAYVDGLLGVPNCWNWFLTVSEGNQKLANLLMRKKKSEYLEMAGDSTVSRTLNTLTVLSSHVSGRLKDLKGCNGIVPTDDLWQITKIVNDKFKADCTTLRHQLEISGLLEKAFGE